MHLGACQDGDITAVLDRLRIESGVGREAKLQRQPLHVRQVHHVECEGGRTDAVSLDHVLNRTGHIEQHPCERPILVREKRQRLEGGTRLPPQQERRLACREAVKLGCDCLVGAPRHGGIAWQDLNPTWNRCLDTAREVEER